MTIRISIIALATLLFLTVLATLAAPANAHAGLHSVDTLGTDAQFATGPLNVIFFDISQR